MATFNPECITYSQMNLIFNARFYYRRLITWTRAYLLSRYYGIGTTEAQFERLYEESIDIGDMLQVIFGRQASEQYSQMVSRYAILFHEIVDAQIAGDQETVRRNVDLLYENVDQRAVYLQAINPYWSADSYRELFNSYIRYVLETANAITERDYERELELYDTVNEHINRMGDTFAQGIYDYVTSGGSVQNANDIPCVTYEQLNDIYTVGMFWFELNAWVRRYMLSRYAGIGNPEMAYARLQQVVVDFVNTMQEFFPEFDADAYLQLFFEYTELLDEFLTAMMENDVNEVNRITRELYNNADARTAFAASISPLWDENQWRSVMYENLSYTIQESTTFLTEDYARNIDIFTRLMDRAETLSSFLSQSLFNVITQQA